MSSWQYSGTDPNNTNTGSISQGYYVTWPLERDGSPMDPANHSPSGNLTSQGSNPGTIELWITQAQLSISMGGSTGQSKRLREFFPRNLVQPVWNIQGIVPNSFQLQRLAEFILSTHFDALNPTGMTTSNLPIFTLYAGGLGDLTQLQQSDMERAGFNKKQINQVLNNSLAVQGKGPHKSQQMIGYINTFSRGAMKFINVPTYEFDFTVAYTWGDLLYTSNANETYKEISAVTYTDIGTGQASPTAAPPNV